MFRLRAERKGHIRAISVPHWLPNPTHAIYLANSSTFYLTYYPTTYSISHTRTNKEPHDTNSVTNTSTNLYK